MTEELLTHHGVKGQKWGVRRDRPTIRDHLNSLSRERQWKKIAGDVRHLSTDEILTVSKRIGLENDLKKLSRNKTITSQHAKNDYTYREKLSDQELQASVHRLRAKESLHKNINNASKEQREIGEKVVNVTKALAYTYAKNQRLTAEDIFKAYKNPKDVKDKVGGELKVELGKKIVTSLTKTSK